MEDRIRKIIEGWYIYENALFEISLTHALKENRSMRCAMRCGDNRIEYNPAILEKESDDVLESMLMVECIRIILKHPYERQPRGCSPTARLMASDMVIGDHYLMPELKLPKPSDYDLPSGKSYEWYAYHLHEMLQPAPVSAGTDKDDSLHIDSEYCGDAVAMWQENDLTCQMINNTIANISESGSWGNLPKDLVTLVEANIRASIDYRKILGGFRGSVLSAKRNLTRMRPNRRTGFAGMGSIRRLRTRLLVAVDDSGSITDDSLQLFFSVINSAFKYGIETLDVITFDAEIHDVMEFSQARSTVKVTGRGGTDFQPAIDYAHAHGYDGLLFFTDGEAPVPKMPPHPRFKIVWVFNSKDSYDRCHAELRKLGRCCYIDY